MMAIIAKTPITPITMPAMAPVERPVWVWGERLEVGIVSASVVVAGPKVGEVVASIEVWTVFGPVVIVATPGGEAMEPMVTRFL